MININFRNLRIGDNGDDVTELVQILKTLHYLVDSETASFNQNTVRAIRAFQNDHGLPATGATDPVTWDAITKSVGGSSGLESTGLEPSVSVMASPVPPASAPSRPIIKQGDSGPYVLELKQILNRLGYLSGVPDDYFGSTTGAAVRAFQRDNNLAADGIVGPQIWTALQRADVNLGLTGSRPVLREGSTGLRVKEVQLRLKTLGYYSGALGEVFNNETTAAVKSFQRFYGLTPDGIVGPQTWAALDNAFSGTPTPPTQIPSTTLQEGNTGEDVVLLQDKLRVLQYYFGESSGIFDSTTTLAVRNFQKAYGLEVNGIVDPQTWNILSKAVSVPSSVRPIIQEGSTGDNVTILQEKLKFLGFFAASVTGSFGPETTDAVKAFQKSSGLTQDGIVNAATWAAIFEQTTTPAPPNPSPGGPRPTLRLGDTGTYVTELQTELQLLMFYDGEISGLFDEETEVAVKTFQDTNQLTPDGVVGRKTWQYLASLYPPPVICP